MNRNQWQQLENGISEEELASWKASIDDGGYSAFHMLLEGFKNKLKQFQESDSDAVISWITTARELFPQPERFSPSWSQVWDELQQIAEVKIKLLQTVAPGEREGEWQLILDNPHTIQEVVCHTGLSFHEAAYLYSYFRPGLQKNEYIRLQKVQSMYTEIGS
ncbi:hypothetical protein [Paenibacillus sp. OAS669]|uniref:hypothetical protein n=1 Tax=Paenibacillus sp. OAS669 TaxID=2663821 RepID=UPI00178A9A5D|nr:hypothetical protein [Paenibacillus sp. OAS669]MBE1442024.1 hypothetical protein [Paenibacillus sp. OAS669]